MDKLQRSETKELIKSVMKIDRHNFKQKMMTAVMFFSGLTANGSNFFTQEDFRHLPGLEKTITVAENLINGNQLKEDLEKEKFKEQGLEKQPHADNYAHKYADVQNGEEGLRAAMIAYLLGLGKEAKDVVAKTILSTDAGDKAYKQDIANKQEFEKNSQEKGTIIAAMIYLCNMAKNEHTFRTTILKQLLKNEKILDKDVVLGIANECLKDIGNNGWALKEGVKIAYTHRLENLKKFLSGQPMTDLDIKHEAQEAVRYLDLDSNTMGTKDNKIADAINARDMQRAQENTKKDVNRGILRVRHNLDAGTMAPVEEIRRRLLAYAKNATVASNSEKYNSGDGRMPSQFDETPEIKADNLSGDYISRFLKKLEELYKQESVQFAKSVLNSQDNTEAFMSVRQKIKQHELVTEAEKTDKSISNRKHDAKGDLPIGWSLVAKGDVRS